MHTTPVSLLERLRQPDQQAAWTRFVELYTPLLYHWSKRLGLQESDAADLVQEVFVVLLQKLPEFTYDRRKSFRGWLRTVLLHKSEDRRRRQPPPPAPHVAATDLLEERGPDVLEEVEYRQYLVGRALQVMQRDFQPVTWKACWEHVVADRPAAEVAAELDISVGSVYAAKSRVLRRLRQELEGLLE